MKPFWIETNQRAFCMEFNAEVSEASETENLEQIEKELMPGEVVKQCSVLPHPASPRVGEKSDCPSFCYTPNQCKGRGACPRNPSCTS